MRNEQGMREVTIFVGGKQYAVPYDLTIMDAMEAAGFRLIRGVGCRQGMCGACATLYRLPGDYRLHTALACQELVQDGMHVYPVPYTPTTKARYDLETLDAAADRLVTCYPEVARCLCCNTCTKVCPQELEVMTVVQAALQGDLETAAHLSFECVECGLCAMRCPAEIMPHLVARLARRLYGRYVVGLSHRVDERQREIASGRFNAELAAISEMDLPTIRERYRTRDFQ